MFNKKEKQPMRKEIPIEKSEIKAFLGPGSQFEGKLVFNEIVRLDGGFLRPYHGRGSGSAETHGSRALSFPRPSPRPCPRPCPRPKSRVPIRHISK